MMALTHRHTDPCLFQRDQSIKDRVSRILGSNVGAVHPPETRAQGYSRLYREAQSEPQGLKHFEQLAEEEEKRYAEEQKVFKETL